MSAPSYTYTLTNSTTADASQVMQNFNDVLNGITDGTKDLTISALTANGAVNMKGNVTLGDASADDVTITGSLAATIPIKTNTSFDFGSSTKGLANLYLGGSSTFTAKLTAATLSASRVYTIPEVSADASFVMTQGAQTAAGVKTFSSGIVLGSGSTLVNYTTWADFSSSVNLGINSGGGSLVGTTVNYARWMQLGKMVTVQVRLTTFKVTSANSTLQIILPVAPSQSAVFYTYQFSRGDGYEGPGRCTQTASSTTLVIGRGLSGSTWTTTATADSEIDMLFSYEVA